MMYCCFVVFKQRSRLQFPKVTTSTAVRKLGAEGVVMEAVCRRCGDGSPYAQLLLLTADGIRQFPHLV